MTLRSQNVAQYPPYHITQVPAKFEVASSNVLGGYLQENTLFDHDLGVKITHNVVQKPSYHVSYLPAKFEVATSNSLGGDTFTRK